ncbi:uncharacterized protein F4812DRAFT_356638 [Daldinia caldariorum]|uniref:uncharacterized protein n=1 Tax=Daldinia caldariorum TaxID=326644 RepID=UPI0020074178|nr:uncharacterized protein F4812DRAFT_356638 [Daldinia caldariorum]KAI1469054.1 hypothetical protein F4812DRAFT_356638 [Daldinia caldariorum]
MAAIVELSQPTIILSGNPVPYTRLHITPLDESLLSVVVPSSVLPRARNISYHTLETFPEKRYGFVDLPTAEADKLKRKLNGAVLKGTKMRIERARPESIPEPTGAAGENEVKNDGNDRKKLKKRKREIDVTPGVELEDRKIKRGWTTTEREMIDEKRKKGKEKNHKDKDGKKKKKRETKSKYTDGPECLFKTKLPGDGSSKGNQDLDQTKKKRKSGREVVMHEFEKTIKHPSFLKSNVEKSSSVAVTFEDGVGWVDEHGTVVEPAVSKRPIANASSSAAQSKPSEPPNPAEDDDTTSSSGSSSDDSEDDEDRGQVVDSSDDDDKDDSENEDNSVQATPDKQPAEIKLDTQTSTSPVSILKTGSARHKSSGSTSSLTIKIPPATPAATEVHPLEALYKRPQGDGAGDKSGDAQPFSFFDGDDNDIEEEDAVGPPIQQPPMTPFTKQDFDYRNVRSAAPTPDTAHPSRSFNLWPRQGSVDDIAEDDEDEGDGERGGAAIKATSDGINGNTATSDFQRQFWESRGDLNRSWRRRRKTVSKEKRYRENRVRAERAI